MKPRFKVIPEVYLVLVKADTVLLQQRCGTGYEDGKYGLVSGHVDGGEPLDFAMIREAREEAGIDIEPKDLALAHVIHRNGEDERIGFFFICRHWEGEVIIAEPDKCSDIRWCRNDYLPDETIPYIRSVLHEIRTGRQFSSLGW